MLTEFIPTANAMRSAAIMARKRYYVVNVHSFYMMDAMITEGGSIQFL